MKDRTLFENTETAFVLKSDSELERAYFLFKMIEYINDNIYKYYAF